LFDGVVEVEEDVVEEVVVDVDDVVDVVDVVEVDDVEELDGVEALVLAGGAVWAGVELLVTAGTVLAGLVLAATSVVVGVVGVVATAAAVRAGRLTNAARLPIPWLETSEPTSTPKAIIAMTAIAAARGAGTGVSSSAASRSPTRPRTLPPPRSSGAAAPVAPVALSPSARRSASDAGRAARRVPHSTQ
jgi:hypothetical protein